ncbi:MAG: hypothetical protein NZ520_08760, partial [bacterium]|nr:hypothetical protein [bacterium]
SISPPVVNAPGAVSEGSAPTTLPPRASESTPIAAPAPPRLSEPPRVAAPPPPERVRICADSGLLASRYCPEVLVKTFPAGKAPSKRCNLHRPPPGEE